MLPSTSSVLVENTYQHNSNIYILSSIYVRFTCPVPLGPCFFTWFQSSCTEKNGRVRFFKRMRYCGAADSACTSICVCVLWMLRTAGDGEMTVCAVYYNICMFRYNVYALLCIHIGIWETLINMCIRPAGAAAASTAGIGAVSHSRHVLLVIFVLFNKKTIKSRHI